LTRNSIAADELLCPHASRKFIEYEREFRSTDVEGCFNGLAQAIANWIGKLAPQITENVIQWGADGRVHR
jgi:hypothetical protein